MQEAKCVAVLLGGIFVSEVFVPVTQSLLKIKKTSDGVNDIVSKAKSILGIGGDTTGSRATGVVKP